MMKKYSPGASMSSDYAYGCDICQVWGKPVLVWDDLHDGGCFSICHDCLSDVYLEHIANIDKKYEKLLVRRRTVSEKVRIDVFARDGNKCLHCGSDENLTLDHIIPFSRGGKTCKKNLQTLCLTCNLKKGVK